MPYLNNAATTWPKPEIVYQTMDWALRSLHSPLRGAAAHATPPAPGLTDAGTPSDLLGNARRDIAAFLGIRDSSRLVFTPGCTYSLNAAILGLPWAPGDAAVMSSLEHHAVSRPLRKLARERGVDLRIVPYAPGTPFDLSFLARALADRRVRLVACTMASNVTGEVLPFREVVELAHRSGALCLLDGAQAAGVIPVNIGDLAPDFFTTAGHKGLFGPPGVGLLYTAPHVALSTVVEGGTGRDSGKHPMTSDSPTMFEIGTHNLPAILGLAAGVRWLSQTGPDAVRRHEHALVARLLAGLERIPGVRIHGHIPGDVPGDTPRDRTSAVSLSFDRRTPQDVGALIASRHGVVGRFGYHCSPMAHEALGTLPGPGTLRLSPGYFNTDADIDLALHALADALA